MFGRKHININTRKSNNSTFRKKYYFPENLLKMKTKKHDEFHEATLTVWSMNIECLLIIEPLI